MLSAETVVRAALGEGTPFTVSTRGISGVRSGDALSFGLPAPFVHIFDGDGLAVGALANWRADYIA